MGKAIYSKDVHTSSASTNAAASGGFISANDF